MLKNASRFLASLLFILLTGEIVVRLLGVRGEVEWTLTEAIPVNDRILNFRLKPGSVTFTGDVVYEMNSKGFRDSERKHEKESHMRRIVVIGDSVAYGYGVKFEDTFPRQLEGLLRVRHGTGHLEVVNLAIPGLNTLQESHVLLREGSTYNPEMVILAFSLNDAEAGIAYGGAARARCSIELLKIPLPCSLKRTVKKSAFLYFIKDRLDNLFWMMDLGDKDDVFGSMASDYFNRLYMQNSNFENHILNGLENIAEFSKRSDFHVIVVIFPIMFDSQDYKWAWIHEKIAKAGAKLGFYVVDLLEDYRKYPIKQIRVERGDFVHPNAVGHGVAAQAIDRFLIEHPEMLAGKPRT